MPAYSINGQIVPASEARIPVQDHGLLYGDGVFEGLRFYKGKVFKLEAHMVRLYESAAAIGLRIPQSSEELISDMQATIESSGLEDGYIRLVVTRGVGALGLDPNKCSEPNVIVIVDKLVMTPPEKLAAGVKLIISSIRRLGPDQIDPRVKSLNYLNQILAKQEANHAGADEAILLNQAGRVAEGTADNLFIVKGGVLMTPPTSEGALAGITRATILELANEIGLPTQEVPLAPYELFTAEECFLTGTGAELIPVATISGRELPSTRPVFEKLQKAFFALVNV